MAAFRITDGVHLGISHAVLLLYRYLTHVYFLGDLSLVQFINGYDLGRRRKQTDLRVLTVSGNGVGELQMLLASDPRVSRVDLMTVKPMQMHIMRMLSEASAERIEQLWAWAREQTRDYPILSEAFSAAGLEAYWQEECAKWQKEVDHGKVMPVGGSPWSLVPEPTYDAILLSHAQTVLYERDAKGLMACLKPGGLLALVMPIVFAPPTDQPVPSRFADTAMVRETKAKMRELARAHGYDLHAAVPQRVQWTRDEDDVFQVVSFMITRPMRSLLTGELLIYSLQANMPDSLRLSMLEAALVDVPPGMAAGRDVYQLMLAEKPVDS